MAKRRKMSRGKDRKVFSKTARGTNKKNLVNTTVMRGGYRL